MPRELQPCGTYAAARRHMNAGEKLCGPCLEARRRYDRERRPRKRPLQPCGTHAAYQRHLHHGEEPCGPCREAAREAGRRDWAKRRALQVCGTYAAYKRHRKRGEKPCEPCRVAANAYQRERWADRQRQREAARRAVPPENAHRAPCFANPGLWDPQGEQESAKAAQGRWREAVSLCVTACPVFAHCRETAVSGAAGVVAGRVPGRVS